MQYADSITIHEADVVVCGAGLAGMRAALSAAGVTPQGRKPVVLQLSVTAGASGSSFANVNDALGILAPQTPYHAELLEQRITEIAGVSYLDKELVRILLDDAPARVRDMEHLGVSFHAERHTACFFPEAQVARIFSGLSDVHTQYAAACSAKGVQRVSGLTVIGVLLDAIRETRVCGVVGMDGAGNIHVLLAPAVILALGGPGTLFSSHVCGPHVSGISYGLLRSVEAHVANASFLQCIWYGGSPRRFVSAAQALASFSSDALSDAIPLNDELLRQRENHCPYAWHMPDNAVDHALLARADVAGVVPCSTLPGGMLLLAHAGNGGAVIDGHGQTNVQGLYACGECATGMHGANRIGGSMVLATQVFGHRAGEAAARRVLAGEHPPVDRAHISRSGGPFDTWLCRMKMDGYMKMDMSTRHSGMCGTVASGTHERTEVLSTCAGPYALSLSDESTSQNVLPHLLPQLMLQLPLRLYQVCVPCVPGVSCTPCEGALQGTSAAEQLEALLLQILAENHPMPLERLQLLSALEIVQHKRRLAGVPAAVCTAARA